MNEKAIEKKALIALELEREVSSKIAELKEAQDRITNEWKSVERAMIENDIKSIKGDFGTLTIAERINWTYTDELPKKFYKKVVDTKKLTDTFRLEGKAPKGSAPNYTKYLTRRLKGEKA